LVSSKEAFWLICGMIQRSLMGRSKGVPDVNPDDLEVVDVSVMMMQCLEMRMHP
jgi:hypothetical protein